MRLALGGGTAQGGCCHAVSLGSSLFASDTEADSGAEVCPQSWITCDFLVEAIENVFRIAVDRYTRIDFVPAPSVQQKISRSVIDTEAVKVGVRAWTDKAAAEISTPTRTDVCEQRGG
jgi:hypothetical protein